jgi:CsoR family transcriptional regulator, copper-sensing transcriptional repressor
MASGTTRGEGGPAKGKPAGGDGTAAVRTRRASAVATSGGADDASHPHAEHSHAPDAAHATHVGCGCGLPADDAEGRKALAVDRDGKERNVKRLRRIEGQVRGLQKMVDEDRYCADILTQISSVHEALRAVGRELMRNHLKHCATSALRGTPEEAESMYDELVEMLYKHSR